VTNPFLSAKIAAQIRELSAPVSVPVPAHVSPACVTCPCCGHVVADNDKATWFDLVMMRAGKHHTFGNIIVDFEELKLVVARRKIKMTEKEWKILALLISHYPGMVTREKFTTMVFDQKFDANTRSLDTFIAKMRHYLGRHIETVHCVGYRWVADPQKAVKRIAA
jgi:DNA-binding response OmpR family regulator